MTAGTPTTPAAEPAPSVVLAVRLPSWLYEYVLPLLLFAALTVALSWPTVRDFGSKLVSNGGDARHNLWVLWHYKEALLGRTAWFSTDLLYYPQGASLLTHGLGPVMALFALPFWPWGAVAAHNGATLVGFCLTGYFMYLLARGLILKRGVALFAGLMLLTAPMHLAGLWGHMTKVFLGLLPLALLAFHHALQPQRSRWWTVATALVMLATLLHNGYQFVFATLALGLYAAVALLAADPVGRADILKRSLLVAVAGLVIVGPLLFATVQASQTETVSISRNLESFQNQPDVAEFVLPSYSSRFFGRMVLDFLARYEVKPTIETTVSLPLTGMLLSLLVLLKGRKEGRWWLLLTLIFVVLAMGPALKLLGTRNFTEYGLPVILPYALMTQLPGMDFMRAPGRFMMIGYVTFAMAGAFGLAWLSSRLPRLATPIILAASLLLLLESWPRLWPQEALRPVPQFYRELAADPALYGVFDLPIKPASTAWDVGYSSYYQMYQMTHGKGIAAGYLSRVYERHPLFPCFFSLEPTRPDVLVNGEPASCYVNAQHKLVQHGYRYVVWHKPQEEYPEYKPGSWGEDKAREFIDTAFGQVAPLVDDDLVRVYTVGSLAGTSELTTTIELGDNWYGIDAVARWAASPATLSITSPRQQRALLQIAPATMHDPRSANGAGTEGVLTVRVDNRFSTSVNLVTDETASVPIPLLPGSQTITLTLQAGNFHPTDYGELDSRLLSFSIRSINLQAILSGERFVSVVEPASQLSEELDSVVSCSRAWVLDGSISMARRYAWRAFSVSCDLRYASPRLL